MPVWGGGSMRAGLGGLAARARSHTDTLTHHTSCTLTNTWSRDTRADEVTHARTPTSSLPRPGPTSQSRAASLPLGVGGLRTPSLRPPPLAAH